MKIAVIGSGTVGVMSVCHFLYYTLGTEVHCIHDPNKKILGIGESTNIQIPDLFYKSVDFNPFFENKELDLTMKYGVVYKNWRRKDFLSPIMPPNFAFHFNNFKLKDVMFKKVKKLYKSRFKEILATATIKENSKDRVVLNFNGSNKTYDYVIDCSGYPESYTDYTESSSLPLNHALVNVIDKPGDWNFTYHQATKNGWMFGIPLHTRQGWGYLFNDKITSKKEAIKDMTTIFKTDKLNLKEFKFKPYRAKKFLHNRVLKNGNKAIFYEPLEALSGVFYDNINRALIDRISNVKSEDEVNKHLGKMAERYENFICFVYHGGSIYKSKFWSDVCKKTKKHLKNSQTWKETVDFINNANHEFHSGEDFENFPFCVKLYKLINNNLQYEIFERRM